MKKPAALEHVIHPALRARYSPRAFNEQPLAPGTLRQLMEAARRAASCFNEQPWRFLLAERNNRAEFDKMLGCLVPFNQGWARTASALIITVAKQTFSRNDKPNQHAWHDVGLAIGALTAQAQALGISLHQMAGFDGDKARSEFGIEQGYDAVTAIAVGYPGDIEVLPEAMREDETGPRTRRAQRELVFSGQWQQPAQLDGEAEYEELLSFWFGALNEDGMADEAHVKRWFTKDAEFDALLRERFGALHLQVLAGRREHWLTSARGRLAYVVALDQLSRNMYRDTPGMYVADERAAAAASEAVALQLDTSLATAERVFMYMPFMHAEDLPAQERCIALMASLAEGLTGEAQKQIENNVKYAELHRDIVRDYGRFPHRNNILGRASSPEEEAFLAKPGSSF